MTTAEAAGQHPEAPVIDIETEQAYANALAELERLQGAPEGSVEHLLAVAYGNAIERYLATREGPDIQQKNS